jgi:hypothetical protein
MLPLSQSHVSTTFARIGIDRPGLDPFRTDGFQRAQVDGESCKFSEPGQACRGDCSERREANISRNAGREWKSDKCTQTTNNRKSHNKYEVLLPPARPRPFSTFFQSPEFVAAEILK